MITLIKREIQDQLIIYIIGAAVMLLLTATVIYTVILEPPLNIPTGIPRSMLVILSWYVPFLLVGATLLGTIQMYSDKTKKISAFLSTRAITRRRILSAKIIAGLLWLLLIILPMTAADVMLLRFFPAMPPLDMAFPLRLLTTISLASLCCYAIGLHAGLKNSKRAVTYTIVLTTPILLSLTVIKGFGYQTFVILSLFAAAMLVRTWQKFMSTAL